MNYRTLFFATWMVFFVSPLCSQAQVEEYFEETEVVGEESVRSDGAEQYEVLSLRELEKFNDIAVIQKKYLGKTKRFEFWGAGALALNSQFYNYVGGHLALSYHFDERWSLELEGLFLTDMEKSLTENLFTKQNIVTRSIVVPSSYYGLNLMWSPVYGKITLRERTINPFEMYFGVGVGMTQIDDGQSVGTFHGTLGQFYPLSKNTTLRWGLGYNFFQANARANLNGSIRGEKVDTSLFYLSVGLSVYLPFSEER